MDPKPKQPAGPATRSTVYDDPTPPAPDPAATPAQPQPATPAAPPAALPPTAPEEADGEEALTDPSTPVQPDTSGDTDPGASRNADAHPL